MKTYKNIGKVENLGIAPGETGDRDISEAQEKRMIDRKAIEVVTSGGGTPAEKPEEKETPTGTPGGTSGSSTPDGKQDPKGK
jgi:hypothetical protein